MVDWLAPLRSRLTGDSLPLLTLNQLRRLAQGKAEASIRARCTTSAVGEGVSLCRALGRYKLLVSNSDRGLGPHLMLDGYWEIWLTRALLHAVRPGMVVADVGANIGYYSVLMADLAGPTGKVHAFEPNPLILPLLRRSVELNGCSGRVAVHAEPLSRTSGEIVSLVVPPDLPQNAHLAAEPREGALQLTTAALDDILTDRRLDVIKIDAEGAEQDIWAGMQAIIAAGRSMTVFMEYAADRYAAPDLFLASLQQHGFSLSYVDHFRGIVPVTAAEVLRGAPSVDWMLVLAR